MANEEEAKTLEQAALSWPERAGAITIVDQPSYDSAAMVLVDIVDLRKKIVAHHKPIKEATHNAHKAAVAAEKKLLDPLQEAEQIIKSAIGTWDREQERLRQEEQRKLAEAQRKADEEARLALAAEAEASGATEETIEEILETQVVHPSAVVASTYRPANGVSTRQNWKAEVTDIKALCCAVADGKAAATLVLPNTTALNQLARAMRETFNVPGCRAVADTVVGVRR